MEDFACFCLSSRKEYVPLFFSSLIMLYYPLTTTIIYVKKLEMKYAFLNAIPLIFSQPGHFVFNS